MPLKKTYQVLPFFVNLILPNQKKIMTTVNQLKDTNMTEPKITIAINSLNGIIGVFSFNFVWYDLILLIQGLRS